MICSINSLNPKNVMYEVLLALPFIKDKTTEAEIGYLCLRSEANNSWSWNLNPNTMDSEPYWIIPHHIGFT